MNEPVMEQQETVNRTARTQWPIEVKEKARDLVVRLGWTIRATCKQLGIPEQTAYMWGNEEDWTGLKAKLARKRLEKVRAEASAPIVVVKAPEIEPQETSTQTRINETLRQIDRIDEEIRSCDAELIPKLVAAKSALWSLVHPKTGTIRPSRKKSHSTSNFGPIDPIPSEPLPQPAGNEPLPN